MISAKYCASLLLIAAVATVPAAATDTPVKVLFIGNSFTNQNDLPTTFARLAMDAGWQPPAVTNAAVSSQTLEYHTTATGTLTQIDAGGWQYVILQEYSTRPTDSPNDTYANPLKFKQDATFLYDRIKAATPTAAVLLYETWARQETSNYYPTYSPNRDTMQAQLNYHYHDAAENYIPAHSAAADPGDVTVVPVGEAWHANYHGGNLMLHASDKYHPSANGTYLTALIMYGTMYGRSVQGRTPQLGVTTADAAYLQDLADLFTGATIEGGPDGQRDFGVFMGSFEEPMQAADNGFTNRTVSGWTPNSNTTNGLSVRNSANDFFAGTSKVGGVDQNLPAPADGKQYLYVNSGDVSQQLRDVLLPNTEYTVTVAVGKNLKTTYVDTTYFIKFYAGDTLLATATGDTATMTSGVFIDQTVTYRTGGTVAANQPLRIVLAREGTNVSNRLAFDNVRLAVRIDGDFNGDKFVDQADYTTWADTYGFNGTPGKTDMRADANRDGIVDQADYTAWADNYSVGYPR